VDSGWNRRQFLKGGTAGVLALSLSSLRLPGLGRAWAATAPEAVAYRSWEDLYRQQWRWDKVARTTHFVNCWYQSACNWNVYVKSGIVWREEQAGVYPQTNPDVPDYNPRGCQKGSCFSHRMYESTRLRHPLKRVGERGAGKWQRVTWEQALAEIADVFIDELAAQGPTAVAWDTGTQHSFGGPQGIGLSRTATLLDTPLWDLNPDIGDDHEGAAVTCGKIVFCNSADDLMYSKVILIWGGNPIYTQIPNYHFITEARYRGARVITIAPDVNPSSIHGDLWVPVRIGTDAALGLAIGQVIVSEQRHDVAFLKEQTDMPLLVRSDNRLFLRQADVAEGGADDVFFAYDLAAKTIRPLPRDTLRTGGFDPALEGEFEVETRQGKVKVRPVFEVLKEHLRAYTPEKAAKICGTSPELIRRLAREIAEAETCATITQSNFAKFYHGLEMERVQILVLALCGHFGKRGSGHQAFPMIMADAAQDAFLYPNGPLPEGRKALAQQFAPIAAALKQRGYSDEMVKYEPLRQAFADRQILSSVLTLYFHGGLKELMADQRKWDPSMKRDLDEYVQLALDKGWQFAYPDKGPTILFAEGGNILRRFRGYPKLIDAWLPKLRLIVDVNWRISNTGRHADYVLPCTGWYERDDVRWVTPLARYLHGGSRVVDPVAESKSEWAIHCLLAKKIQERARERGITTFQDRQGKARPLDRIYDDLTYGGIYKEDEDAKLAADFVRASANVGGSWEELSRDGVLDFTGIGETQWNSGNATDWTPGETIVANTWHTERKMPWPTLTRRMQFYIDHELYLELGEELPTHKEETIGGRHPLRLVGGHTRHSIHTSWRDSALMLRLQRGRPVMYMNPRDAAARGVRDDDAVRVFNDVGSFEIHAKLAPALAPGQVAVYHAWEPYMFRGGYSQQTVTPSPINPIELAGGYTHLRPMALCCSPGQNDRGVRVDVEKVGAAGSNVGLRH
jgi:DMSO reductase family type II enzyme molybdopterin subunit